VASQEPGLTPDEHDALIAGVRGGLLPGIEAAARDAALAAKTVKAYDFRRPEKFSRDQLRTLEGIHEQFVRLLNSTLAGYLRTPVQFTLESVEQAAYAEFTSEAQEGNLIYVISLDPLPAPLLLEVSAELVFASLDRLLGGAGKRLVRERDATEMERALFQENWLMPVLENLRVAWQTIVSVTPSVGAVDTNASFLQIALPSDVVVAVKTSATIGDGEGRVRLCYTHATLEPIVPQLDMQRLIAPGTHRRRGDDGDNVRRTLGNVRIPIVAQLGSAEVTTEELLELQQGDVIRLDTLVDREIRLLVNGQTKYLGRPGLKKQHLAVRITGVIEDEDNQWGREHGPVGPVG
jgi:flagellar motor switch protein FliM